MKPKGILFAAALAAIIGVFWMISCGGGNGGSDGEISIAIGSSGQDHPLTAGETYSTVFTVTYDPGRFGGSFGALGLDLEDNLSNVVLSPDAGPGSLSGKVLPQGTMEGTLTLRIAGLEAAETVCAEGELFGPFTILLDDQHQPSSASPSSAEATSTAVDIINIGAYSVCVQVYSPIDALADLNRVDFNVSPCSELPADIAGAWAGTYSCTGSCQVPETGVHLTIVQDAGNLSAASYTDSEDGFYQGTVCGRRFSFRGGGDGWEESGTFVIDPGGNTATKTSTYRDISGPCSGTCTDTLTRVP